MNQEEGIKFYNDIYVMAKEIADTMGSKLFTEIREYDHHYANEYRYDTLCINHNLHYDNLSIKIDDVKVFEYNGEKNNVRCKEGKWPEIIKIIHDEIPGYLHKKELEKIELNKKTEEFKLFWKSFINYLNVGSNASDFLKKCLSIHGIEVKYYTIDRYLQNRCTGEMFVAEIPDSYYQIYYNDAKVARLPGSMFTLMEGYILPYVNDFVPGHWTTYFNESVAQAKKLNGELDQLTIDLKTDELLKSFQKTK